MTDWAAFSAKDWWGGSPLEDYTQRAEKATDDYAFAVDALSSAEAEYLRTYHSAFAHTDPTKSDTARRSQAEQDAFEEKVAFKIAEHNVDRAKALLRTRLSVLSAAQSHLRAVERQT